MAKKSDLMGLGMPPGLANRIAQEPAVINSQGASLASATQLGGTQFLVSVTGSNSGSGVALPAIGGEGIGQGALLGDDFIINNQLGATICVYANTATGASTSATISISGTNITGSTGVSIASQKTATFYPITATSWLGLLSS